MMNNNAVFPGQHATITTTTITTNAETQVNPTIRFDKEYLNTLSGQLKLAEIIISCIALLLVSFSSITKNDCALFDTVAVFAVWFNTILLVFYLFHVIERFYKIPWLKVEVISCIAFAALYFLTALWALKDIFSHFFYFFVMFASVSLMLLFGYDAYLKLQALQSGDIAQGSRIVSQVTEVSQPQYRY